MKATIYHAGSGFGMGNILKHEVTLQEHGRCRYAQYNNAPFAVFVPKGKRKARRITEGFRPFMLIVAGWGHMEPPGMFGPTDYSGVLPTKISRYSSCDQRWKTDFNDAWKVYVFEANGPIEIIADYREKDDPIPDEMGDDETVLVAG